MNDETREWIAKIADLLPHALSNQQVFDQLFPVGVVCGPYAKDAALPKLFAKFGGWAEEPWRATSGEPLKAWRRIA